MKKDAYEIFDESLFAWGKHVEQTTQEQVSDGLGTLHQQVVDNLTSIQTSNDAGICWYKRKGKWLIIEVFDPTAT